MGSQSPEGVPLQAFLTSLPCGGRYDSLFYSVLPRLLDAVASIAQSLRSSSQISSLGSSNAFGDAQLNVDVAAENIIRQALANCPSVVTASSEEDPVEKTVHGIPSDITEAYTVAFDPLDGSSIIAPNWTVGTIIGVWEGTSALSQDPRTKQVASVLGVYGPRTTAIVAVRLPDCPPQCFEVSLGDAAVPVVISPSVKLSAAASKTRYFAPANLRAAAEDTAYMALVSGYIAQRYTLRYSGGLVPDVVHALTKGHGVYLSPVTASCPAKLRRLFELCPVAMIVECAGGRAVEPVDGQDVLARKVLDCDERGGLVCGNDEEVDKAVAALRKHS